MKYMIVLFVIIFFSIYGGLNYYIGLRGWQNLGSSIPILNSKLYWIVFWIIAISYLIARLPDKYLPAILSESFEIIGGYWMAIFFYLLLIIPIIDIIRVLNNRIQFLPQRFTQNERTGLVIAVFILVSLTALMIYGTWSGRSPKVTDYNLKIYKNAGKLNKLKVVMVSDIHLGDIVDNSRLSLMVDRINMLKPDVVLIAGDIIDSKIAPFTKQKMSETFRKLQATYGVYGCLGNHDGMLGSVEENVRQFEEGGIKILRDSVVLIDNSFYIAGRDDSSIYRGSQEKRKDLQDILNGIDKTKPILLIDHQPRELDSVQKEGVDLQVSGHTHRGQFFPNNLITSRIYEVDYGYLKKDDLNVVVSSGYGTWGPPIRIGSRSEIVEISLDFNK